MTDQITQPQSEAIAILHSKFDHLFKQIVTAGWNVQSSGDVEAPTGHFALVEVPEHPGEYTDLREAVFEDDADFGLFVQVPFGWYVAVENNLGFIYVYMMPDRMRAEIAYSQLDDQYTAWLLEPLGNV